MNNRRFAGEIERLRDPARVARLEIDRVVGLCLAGISAKTMLDIGTGSGLFAEAFARRGLRVAGVDLRDDMLEAARGFVPTGDFRQAHMESLPYADKSFDLLFMGVVLHEADDLVGALNEARRVAVQRLAVLEWNYVEQDFGPPLDHRLPIERVQGAAQTAQYASFAYHPLAHLSLYILDVARNSTQGSNPGM